MVLNIVFPVFGGETLYDGVFVSKPRAVCGKIFSSSYAKRKKCCYRAILCQNDQIAPIALFVKLLLTFDEKRDIINVYVFGRQCSRK